MNTDKVEQFLTIFSEALAATVEPHLFTTERGYQGHLMAELRARLKELGLPGDPIIEQEYQKTMPLHGITIRPDLIIHIPFDRDSTVDRTQGNFVAIEIKVDATQRKAQDAFGSLQIISKALRYPLTIFLNVGSCQTYATLCPVTISAHTVCFAVQLIEGIPRIVMEGGRGLRAVPG